MASSFRPAALAPVVLALAACGLPKDPDGTMARVQGGVIRVGASQDRPWAYVADGQVRGVEADLVRELARELHARIEWVTGGETALFTALKSDQLDLVIGGVTSNTAWAGKLGVSRPYFTSRTVLAVPAGAPEPYGLKGLQVAVRLGDPAAQKLESEGAVPVFVSSIGPGHLGAAAVEDWRAGRLGLRPTKIVLRAERHILVAPPGENRWILTLDRFLAEREGEVGPKLSDEALR